MPMAVVLAAVGSALATGGGQFTIPAPPFLAEGWEVHSNDACAKPMWAALTLKETRIGELEAIGRRVSDPRDEQYGQYLPTSTIQSMVAPPDSARRVITNFLRNVHHRTPGPSDAWSTAFIELETGTSLAALFNTSCSSLRNLHTGQTAARLGALRLPREVADVVSAVFGVHELPLPPSAHGLEASPMSSDAQAMMITPSKIRTTYNVGEAVGSGNSTARSAVMQFNPGQVMKDSDLEAFFKQYSPEPLQPGWDQVYHFSGDNPDAHSGKSAGNEASLDIQYIMGVAPGVKTEFWAYTEQGVCAGMLKWTGEMLGLDSPPLVVSISYGWQGPLDRFGCTTAMQTQLEANYMKLGVAGVSIFKSSGDKGGGEYNFTLYPAWPATCPWVTAVGGTTFEKGVGSAERAVTDYGSGGGFAVFNVSGKMPDYQREDVNGYLAKLTPGWPPPYSYDPTNRATPDVAALGSDFQVLVNGKVKSIGGTSASSPTVAALFALINDARLAAGKPPMGFANPFIYQNPDAFTDVTVGDNGVWKCEIGWDPVTGLGTPKFDKLLAAAMAAV